MTTLFLLLRMTRSSQCCRTEILRITVLNSSKDEKRWPACSPEYISVMLAKCRQCATARGIKTSEPLRRSSQLLGRQVPSGCKPRSAMVLRSRGEDARVNGGARRSLSAGHRRRKQGKGQERKAEERRKKGGTDYRTSFECLECQNILGIGGWVQPAKLERQQVDCGSQVVAGTGMSGESNSHSRGWSQLPDRSASLF